MTNTYKVIIVGDARVGKTTYIENLLNHTYNNQYVATLGVNVNLLKLSNHPNVIFNCWDCAGSERFIGLGDGYYIEANGAIVMVDIHNDSILSVSKWVTSIKRVCPDIPIVIVLNQCDKEDTRSIMYKDIYDELAKSSVSISNKDGFNMNEPFEQLLKQLH